MTGLGEFVVSVTTVKQEVVVKSSLNDRFTPFKIADILAPTRQLPLNNSPRIKLEAPEFFYQNPAVQNLTQFFNEPQNAVYSSESMESQSFVKNPRKSRKKRITLNFDQAVALKKYYKDTT